ncbi:hypothetical protein Sjap_025974 [Stephania japonica]|uniref:FBD domain-containing protein n=1 Tax=Stephania japonica TaxID=461633 RepID=A0AAP0E5U0_9MAGN
MLRKEEFVLPLCPLNHLKYVALTGLEGHDNELEFLRFLFNRAVNLDLMVINGGGLKDSKFGKADLLNFHEKLMVLSQEFPNVKISFQIRKSNVFCPRKEDDLALPLCPLNRLKYMAVRGDEGDANELELLRFLFNSAVNLERLAISGDGSNNSKIKTGVCRTFRLSSWHYPEKSLMLKYRFRFCKSSLTCFVPT